MRPPYAFIAASTSLVIAASPIDAQTPISLDLATAKPADTTVMPPGSYKVRILDQIPSANYQISTSVGFTPVQPIQAQGQGAGGQPPACQGLQHAIDALNKASTEEDLPRLLHDAQAKADAVAQDCADQHVLLVGAISNMSTDSVAVYTLGPGQYLRIEVTRPAQASLNLAERHWQLVVASTPNGEWTPTFGFGVPVYWNGQQRFSLRQVGTTSAYLIHADNRTRWVEPVPAVFFSWMTPSGNVAGLGRVSLAAGFGADLTNPSIFLGASWTWHANLQVALGASVRQEPFLAGKYSVGDTVQTNLTADQLTESIYKVRPFIAVTLRFGKDPFGTFGWLTGASEVKPKLATTGSSTKGSNNAPAAP